MNLEALFPLTVEAADAGERFDQYLARRFPDFSRSRWSQLIAREIFTCEGKTLDAAHRLRVGEQIEVLIDEETPLGENLREKKSAPTFAHAELAPTIIFENENFMVLNKPTGLAVHPGAGLPVEETLVAWLFAEKKIAAPGSKDFLTWGEAILEEGRPGIVHRLDKGTSGLLVVAKNPRVHLQLAKQFESHEAGREYTALVEGTTERLVRERPPRLEALLRHSPCPIAFRITEEGRCSLATYLERDPKHRTRFRVGADPEHGKKAITHFRQIKSSGEFSQLEVKLETGRTHQIRVHLSFLGFPILGDDVYGGRPHSRIFLHAHRLRFNDPDGGGALEFRAALPDGDEAWLGAQNWR